MTFPSAAIGQRFGPVVWEASERRVLAFRAAISPDDPRGFIPRNNKPLTALPTQAASVEWSLTTRMLQSLLELGLSSDDAERGVVVGQETKFHVPIVAGEKLLVKAHIAGVRPTRSGALVSTIFETRGQDNYLKARTAATTIYRDVACDPAGEPLTPTPIAPPEGAPEFELNLPYGFAHVFSECAEIWNPIHTEFAVARRAGLSEPIVHGVALWAMAGRYLCDRLADGDEQRLKSLSARFLAPTPLGASLKFSYKAKQSGAAYAMLLSDGTAAVIGEARLDRDTD